MVLIERLKEWIAPIQETSFRIDEKAIVGCKATDEYVIKGGKIKIPGVCWTKKETKRVENILDANEIREKFGLPTTPKIEVKRDYNCVKWGMKIGVFALSTFNPKLYSIIKPATDIFL